MMTLENDFLLTAIDLVERNKEILKLKQERDELAEEKRQATAIVRSQCGNKGSASILRWALKIQFEENAARTKERDEAVALVEVMRDALEFFKTFVFDNRVTGTEAVRRANNALSITPSAALAEIQARTLNAAADRIADLCGCDIVLREMAAAKRKGE